MNLLYKEISMVEPVSLSEARAFLGEPDTNFDQVITAMITAARERAETYMNRSVVDRTILLMLDSIPDNMLQKLPKGPVKSFERVLYKSSLPDVDTDVDVDSDADTDSDDIPEGFKLLDPSYYQYDIAADPGYLYFLSRITDYTEGYNSLIIEYKTGWGERTVSGMKVKTPLPEPIINAILMMVRTMFDFREDLIKGTIISRVPQSAEYLMQPYRIFEFI
jgi:hypothetical protein